MTRALIIIIVSVLLFGCGNGGTAAKQASSSAQTPKIPTWKPSNAFGELKLGMGYDEALGSVPDARWNSVSLQECTRDLPLKGCFLSAQDKSIYYRLDGIPLALFLDFNKHGKMTDIGLWFDREGDISREECRILYGRIVDAVATEYGPVGFSEELKPTSKYRRQVFSTERGFKYPISFDTRSQFFIAGSVRNNIEGVHFPIKTPMTEWNKLPYASVSGHYIVVSRKAECHVAITFKSPAGVERREKE